MAAPKGNKFWEARSSHGRKPIFSNPEDLWKACVEYFEWVEANPLWEDTIVSYQGRAKHVPVAKMRAMTMTGLCIFLDIASETWVQWRKHKDFSEITKRVDDIIRDQKFTGASADLLNANIIARDLGLADKSELTGKNGGPVQIADFSRMTDEELNRFIADRAGSLGGGLSGEGQ